MLDATPLLKLYARRRLAKLRRLDPVAAQEKQLRRLLLHAADTRFGREHRFGGIRDVASYQAAVPLRRYEDFWIQYWQPSFPDVSGQTWPGPIRTLAASSGTTSGNTKFIPVTPQMAASNRRAAFDLLSFHIAAKPRSRIMGGLNFMLGGSTELTDRGGGVFTGDLSGIAARDLPWWARSRYFPPPDLARIADWNRKVEMLAPLSIQTDLRMIGGTASWLLAFVERAIACKPDASRIADIYPGLEMLVHGGVSFAPYRHRFDELLAGSQAETREVYPASEGFVAMQDAGPEDGLRLSLDNGLFLEFVPLEELGSGNPTRHWMKTVETGVNYAVILTTNAGLWSYILGDTVRFVSLKPPRVVITGRTSYYLSAFGEHLIGEEIEAAVTGAAEVLDVHLTDYSVGALFPQDASEKGRHVFVVEPAAPPAADFAQHFATLVDEGLKRRNFDYAEHRHQDLQMQAPAILVMPPGGFARWMERRGKLGAQNKVPRVINDADLLRSLMECAS